MWLTALLEHINLFLQAFPNKSDIQTRREISNYSNKAVIMMNDTHLFPYSTWLSSVSIFLAILAATLEAIAENTPGIP